MKAHKLSKTLAAAVLAGVSLFGLPEASRAAAGPGPLVTINTANINQTGGGSTTYGQVPFIDAVGFPKVNQPVKPGVKAPVLKLEGADGGKYRIGGKRDKPLLLSFWASWCEPCRLEAKDMEVLSRKYQAKMDIYGVNVTAYDTEADARKYIEQYGQTFPMLFDRKEAAFGAYSGAAFPTLVFINKKGVIQDIVIGLIPADQLEIKIRKWLQDA